MSLAVIDWPHWDPDALATSWTRLFTVSAMYTSPAKLRVIPPGEFSSADAAVRGRGDGERIGSGPTSSSPRIRVHTGRAPHWIVVAFTAAPTVGY
jgi:hypothetical protein